MASVDLETRKLNFSKALSGVKTFAENLIDFDGANYRQCVTPGHDVIINGKKVKADIAAKMDIAEYDFRLHIDNSFPRIINLEPKMIELLTSVIMDGTIVDYKKYNSRSNKVRIQFHIKKERKIEYIPLDNPYNFPVAYVRYRDGHTSAPDNAKICGGNCSDCATVDGGCWTLREGEAVVFDEH